VFIGDKDERVIGESWQDMNLNLRQERFDEFVKTGIPHQVRIAISGVPAHVKAIVYDFNADLVGSAIGRIR
jgi:hypothetical protein